MVQLDENGLFIKDYVSSSDELGKRIDELLVLNEFELTDLKVEVDYNIR